jgi:hypothetical protein
MGMGIGEIANMHPIEITGAVFAIDLSASPASRASSKSREKLAFVHIPTGTTSNKGIDINGVKRRSVTPASALTAIGAAIQTGGATP